MEGEEDPREVWAAAQQAHDTHDNMGIEGRDRWPVGLESLQCDRSSISFFSFFISIVSVCFYG